MNDLIARLKASYPSLKFTAGKQYCWSPENGEIFYKPRSKGPYADWSLLHESGHALLGHTTYHADLELLRLEVAAWDKAQEVAAKLGIEIEQDHIQDCLDTYRDWLYSRSICPSCTAKCLQQGDFVHYRCHNCHKVWRVSNNLFGRSYRSTKNVPQTAIFL
jgi:hypothetical protein